jgi:hypothetical protein
MGVPIVNERSTAYLSCTFLDKAKQPAEPAAISYRIDEPGAGEEVRGDTAVAAASTIEITLTPADNTLLGEVALERRVVTITATYGIDDAIRDQFIYSIRNLGAVT